MTILKCLTLVALVAVLDAAKFKCDYTLYKDAGGYLKFQEIPLTFEDAKQRCASEGGILASPIYDGIKAAMMSVMKTSRVKSAVLTGFSDKSNHSAIFTSVEGMRLQEIPHTWALNEPKNCIVMLADGTISDVKCDEPYSHFCFINEMSALKLNPCSLKNLKYNDYTFDTTTGSCYKFHNTILVYDEAAKVCQREGGHLLIINGETEKQTVNKLFFINKAVSDYVYIGFRYNKNLGEWMTLQGQTIQEAGYAKWAPGEPNNAKKYEFCGTLDFVRNSHLMNDEICDMKLKFICEKDPEILLCK